MSKQDYSHHTRWYVPQHFIFYPLILCLILTAIYLAVTGGQKLLWFFVITTLCLNCWLGFMLRQHYALTLQDRVVRLEVSYRYFALTQQRIESLVLSKAQLLALRFASDNEFPSLVKRAAQENLSADQIKKSILNWKADDCRV